MDTKQFVIDAAMQILNGFFWGIGLVLAFMLFAWAGWYKFN